MRIQTFRVEIIIDTTHRESVRYRLLDNLNILSYHVPAGFVTDGASVPRIFWGFLPPVDEYFPAAAVHDYLLSFDRENRDFADRAFLECLREIGVSVTVREALYRSVRLYSALRWFKNFLKSRSR